MWKPCGDVSEEDVGHMKNRCYPFSATAVLLNLKETVPCACHMCKWIVAGASQSDADSILSMIAPQRPLHAGHDGAVAGSSVTDLEEFMRSAMIPAEAHAVIARDVRATGAVHIQELTKTDWEQLESWQLLKPLERRRVLQYVPH